MWEGPFDKACRYLLKLDPLALLVWLLGLKIGEAAFIRWLDTRRLPYPGQPNRTCDTVAHVERLDDDHRPWAFVVEFNIEPDSVMFGRLLGYLGTLWIEEKPSRERGDRFEIGAVVVNLTGVGNCSRLSSWPNAGVESGLKVQERNLANFKAADILQQIADGTAPRSLLPWIPLMQNGNESAIIDKWKEVAASEPEYARRLDYGALAIQFADAVKRKDVWQNALREWNMIESTWLKEWEDLGRRKKAAEFVLKVLKNKFGALPADLPNRFRFHRRSRHPGQACLNRRCKPATWTSFDIKSLMAPCPSRNARCVNTLTKGVEHDRIKLGQGMGRSRSPARRQPNSSSRF